MSKKKEAFKRSNSVKSPLNVYPYTNYHRSEIYPHTDYHRQEPFWIYREAGLLKNWLMSLTKLYIMLAQRETDDIIDLVEELKNLIDKLQGLLDGIDNALLALYEAEVIYKADVTEMLSKINDLAGDIFTIINTLNPLFNALFNCIEDRLMKHDTYIEKIENEINNIYEILENMLSENITSSTLVYNTDYTFQFFNGFYLDENPIDRNYLTCEETILTTNAGEFHSKSLNLSFGGNRPLRNDYIYTTGSDDGVCPLFSHGNSVAQSNILVLYLNDENFPNKLNSTTVNNCLFDMNPTKARATWNIDCGVRFDSDFNGVRINMRSIADGFNSQYYYYISSGLSDTIGFDSAGLNIDFTYSYFI